MNELKICSKLKKKKNIANFQCYPGAWYLSVDMQLFVISPLIIYLMDRFNTKIIYVLVVMIVGCVAYTVAVHVKYGLRVNL